jgi:L-2-hydroxycarboxylate dehydrogenase (NAD+)
MIAEAGLIGIVCSRSPASTAGFGFPTSGESLVFDTATSAMTFYGLVLAKARGESIPENMAIDGEGNPTTDPDAAMDGALLSFDRGYKGSGFGLVVEMLAGPLVNGSWVDNKTFKEEWGSLIIAIDPELLVDREEFKKNASDLIDKVKLSRVKSESDSIRLPGERARAQYNEAKMNGFIDVEDAIISQL